MTRLLRFCQDNDSVWWHGALWAAGMAVSEFMRVVLLSISGGVAYRTGTRLRSAVMTLVYKKVIRLTTLDDKSIGNVCLSGSGYLVTFQLIYFNFIVSDGQLVGQRRSALL
jgi:hypothetical protein